MESKTISFSLAGGSGAPASARRSVLSIEAGLPLGVRHRVALSQLRLRVEVLDPGWGDTEPPRRLQHPDGGYGLLLVGHLATDHGREASNGGGSLAWFEIELDDFGET